MNMHTATVGMPGFGLGHYRLDLHLGFVARWLTGKLSLSIETILEYAFVIHIWAAVGYVAGKYAGFVYAEHYHSFVSPELIKELWLASYHFAVYGAIAGVIVGAMVKATLAKSGHHIEYTIET